jgi:hypothetical protein
MLNGVNSLSLTEEVIAVAELLVKERLMPAPAIEGDALHLAVATIHKMGYLVTWNQKHLANPNKRTHLTVVCARVGLTPPQIVTPDLLIVEAVMNKPQHTQEETAVGDVRRVREAIARQHGGNLRAHVAETNRLFERVAPSLGLKKSSRSPRKKTHARTGK